MLIFLLGSAEFDSVSCGKAIADIVGRLPLKALRLCLLFEYQCHEGQVCALHG